MTVPDRIVQLVETFHNNLESYKRGIYNETQVLRALRVPVYIWDEDSAEVRRFLLIDLPEQYNKAMSPRHFDSPFPKAPR
jgi:hypothetical protein